MAADNIWTLNNISELKVVEENFKKLLEVLVSKNVIKSYTVETDDLNVIVGVIENEKL